MRHSFILGLGVCLLMLGACKGHDQQGHVSDSTGKDPVEGGETPAVKPPMQPKSLTLPDGTLVLMDPRTVIRPAEGFGKANREIQVDGEAMITISNGAGKPFIIHTRNLIMEVQAAGSRLHIDAFASSPGEEVDLMGGKLRVTKSYHSSTDNTPEVLQAGEMVMINRDIDLMEKEKLSPAEQKAVEAKFPSSAAPAPRN
jgi:ferric-dicitrate binding protein FerR (iron transport regulator)